MSKFYMGFFIAALIFILAGCGTKITKEEVVNKAIETDINSFEIEGAVQIEISANGQDMTQSFDLGMKYITDPFISHIDMSTVDGNIEMYMDRDTTYMLLPSMEGWLKTSTNSTPEFAEIANGESISEELERLKEFSNLFDLESLENGYVLKVKLTEDADDEGTELVQELLQESVQDVQFDDIKINAFEYILTLDKDFLLKSAIANLNLDVTAEGEAATVVTNADVNYTNINKVEEFSVPVDIVDNASEY
jgi:hypothetical protein